MSTNRRTEYDLIDATARNTKRAANSAAFVAGATVVNTFETARLRRLQKEGNDLQRRTQELQEENNDLLEEGNGLQEENNDLQRRTQELQEESNSLQASVLRESQATNDKLNGLGYNVERFLSMYASDSVDMRRQMAVAQDEFKECTNLLSRNLDQSRENAQLISATIKQATENSDDREDWRRFKIDWLPSPDGKHYRAWRQNCRSTLNRVWEYHNAMVEARENDRKRLIAKAIADRNIPQKPELAPKESFFTEEKPVLETPVFEDEPVREKEPVWNYPPKPDVGPEVKEPAFIPKPAPYQWRKHRNHVDFFRSDTAISVISLFALLGCIASTIATFNLWGYRTIQHKGFFAVFANASEIFKWCFSLIKYFLICAVASIAIGMAVTLIVRYLVQPICNVVIDFLNEHQKPSKADRMKIEQYETELKDWQEWYDKIYEVEYRKYQTCKSEKEAAEKAWKQQYNKVRSSRLAWITMQEAKERRRRQKNAAIKRAHEQEQEDLLKEWGKEQEESERAWEAYVQNEYNILNDRRRRCISEVENHIPAYDSWSMDDYRGWSERVKDIIGNAYHNYPAPEELPPSGMVRLRSIDFFPEDCLCMRNTMAWILLNEEKYASATRVPRQPNGISHPNLLMSGSANADKKAGKRTPSGTKDGTFILSNSIKREDGRRIEARLIADGDGFLVLKGSTIALTETSSCPQSVSSVRKDPQYVKNGEVIRDVPFSSPSAAAGFVLGSSCNGWEKWKTNDGKTLKETRT